MMNSDQGDATRWASCAEDACAEPTRIAVVLGNTLRIKTQRCRKPEGHDGFHAFPFEWEGPAQQYGDPPLPTRDRHPLRDVGWGLEPVAPQSLVQVDPLHEADDPIKPGSGRIQKSAALEFQGRVSWVFLLAVAIIVFLFFVVPVVVL